MKKAEIIRNYREYLLGYEPTDQQKDWWKHRLYLLNMVEKYQQFLPLEIDMIFPTIEGILQDFFAGEETLALGTFLYHLTEDKQCITKAEYTFISEFFIYDKDPFYMAISEIPICDE